MDGRGKGFLGVWSPGGAPLSLTRGYSQFIPNGISINFWDGVDAILTIGGGARTASSRRRLQCRTTREGIGRACASPRAFPLCFLCELLFTAWGCFLMWDGGDAILTSREGAIIGERRDRGSASLRPYLLGESARTASSRRRLQGTARREGIGRACAPREPSGFASFASLCSRLGVPF
jgi:hypothetical protein